MKHSTFKRVACMLLCSMCIGNNFVYGQASCKNDSIALPGTEEPPIDLTRYIKLPDDIQDQRNLFLGRFRCKINGVSVEINAPGERIKMSALLALYVKSKTAADNFKKTRPDSSTVTSVRIWFGMHDNDVRFFYQPVFLAGKIKRKEFKSRSYNIEGEELYSYDEGQQAFIPAVAPQSFLDAYKKQIRIKHHGGSDFDYMRVSDGWKGDSRAILFSFQEIFHLYHKTFDQDSDDDRYCRELVINNGAANYRRKILKVTNPVQRWRAKHTVYITGVLNTVEKNRSAAALVAAPPGANLAHLCPPSCNSINYSVR